MHFRPLLIICVACVISAPVFAVSTEGVASPGAARAVSDTRLAELAKETGARPGKLVRGMR